MYDLRLLKIVALYGLSTWKILSEEPSICSPPLNYPPPLKVVGVEWVLILTPKVVEKRFHVLINSACTIPVQPDKIIKGDSDVFYVTKKKISKPLPFRPVSIPTTTVTVPMSVLIGDTTANKTVNASDVSQTKGQVGQTTTSSNKSLLFIRIE